MKVFQLHDGILTHVGLVVNLGDFEGGVGVESTSARGRNAACEAQEGLRMSAQQRGLHLEDLCVAKTQ